MKHNTLTKIITLALAVVLALSLAACGSKTDDNSGDAAATTIKIGVPNDTTNEARALLLLQENGIIKRRPRPPSCPTCCPTWTTPSSTATTPSTPV